ncbi:fibronectin type III domain-containing protein [Spirosoma sordidisoli]|nr:fibronectin type III domain-containing protein [Spirosoma sordidisoli]
MIKIYTIFIIAVVYLCIHNQAASAQVSSLTAVPACGTTALTPAQARLQVQLATQALERKRAQTGSLTAITYVPIRPHIFRRSNGTGGFDLASMNQVMALTNSYFLKNDTGIQFYFSGSTPDYIDDDGSFANFDGSLSPRQTDNNALNQYYANHFSGSLAGYGGLASFPYDNPLSTHSYILTNALNDPVANLEWLANNTVPHELGHNFSLYHTFGFGNGTQLSKELVTRGSGANCLQEGDFLCDTPADPYGRWDEIGYINVNGCLVYSPTSTARDANGELYAPSMSNIMSYWQNYRSQCAHEFTPDQNNQMQAALALRQTHTSYTLNAPPANVTPPSGLIASLTSSSVQLVWQDNATNEMGYFIERSVSPTTSFVPIGGVAPDGTTFTDATIAPQTTYYYRIRPSNTTTGSLSPTTSIDVALLTLTATNITSAGVQLAWREVAACSAFDLRYRPVGAPDWITVSGLTTTSYALTALSGNTPYEWQVRATCPNTPNSLFTPGPAFTTQCGLVSGLSATALVTSASLTWTEASGTGYDLRYRPAGTTTWTTVGNLSSTRTTLTGLASGSSYEWQVRVLCRDGAAADFSPPAYFQTASCSAPYGLQTTTNANAAQLRWNFSSADAGTRYEIRYRVQGTTDWTTISDLGSTNGVGTLDLTGLLTNTSYEWQIRTLCSPTEASGFSGSAEFTPRSCEPPLFPNSQNVRSQSAFLSWSTAYYDPGRQYQIRYRPVNTPTWTSTSSVPTTSYSLTGLSNNTQYEWQVRTACLGGSFSDYTPSGTFTTVCLNVVGMSSQPAATAASFYWSYAGTPEPNSTYELQYRPLQSLSWTTVVGYLSGSYTTQTVTGLAVNTTYEARLRTLCSPGAYSDYLPVITFTTGCYAINPDYMQVTGVWATAAQFRWSHYTDAETRFDLRYRPAGTANWTNIDGLTTTSYSLTGLTNSTQYEWQVRAVCSGTTSSTFTHGPLFTTQCAAPVNVSVNAFVTSAAIGWLSPETGAGFEIRYRLFGTADWIMINTLTAPNATITGLTSNSKYEWQVRTRCSDGLYSAFSDAYTFQTASCSAPFGLQALTNVSSARLSWTFYYADADSRYELRYRALGTTDWTLVGNLSSTNRVGTTDLTGLLTNTTYEWQIRTICSASEGADFVAGTAFTTQCASPNSLYVQAKVTSATLNWSYPGFGTQYQIRYRPTGSENWLLGSAVTGTEATITGLTGNTAYEWQVRTLCESNVVSEFSGTNGFTTPSCAVPVNLMASLQTSTSARLNWSYFLANAETRYEVRYRIVNAADWIVLAGLGSTNGQGFTDITGLTANLTYEWQIRTLCSATEASAFSASVPFTTNCLNMATVKAGLWNDPAVWSCNRVPVSTDVVYIRHVITIPASLVAVARQVRVDLGQRLVFSTNAQLKAGQ